MQSDPLGSQLAHLHRLFEIQFKVDWDKAHGPFEQAVSGLFNVSRTGKDCPFESLFRFLTQILTAIRRIVHVLGYGSHTQQYVREAIQEQVQVDDLSDLSGIATLDKKFKALKSVSNELGPSHTRCERFLQDWLSPEQEPQQSTTGDPVRSNAFDVLIEAAESGNTVQEPQPPSSGNLNQAAAPFQENIRLDTAVPDSAVPPWSMPARIIGNPPSLNSGPEELSSPHIRIEPPELSAASTSDQPREGPFPNASLPGNWMFSGRGDVPSSIPDETLERTMESLSSRGKGHYTCPYGENCTKGGCLRDGTVAVFERNSAYK
ncbi:MAG: hypothetical protein Q9227_006560 [Pyrenula ochraceoflavens]